MHNGSGLIIENAGKTFRAGGRDPRVALEGVSLHLPPGRVGRA